MSKQLSKKTHLEIREIIAFISVIIFISLQPIKTYGTSPVSIKYNDNLLSGTWYFANSENSLWTEFGTLTFDIKTHQYRSYDGCNRGMGDYYYSGKNIIFRGGSITAMFCDCVGFGIPVYEMPLSIDKVNFKDSYGVRIGGNERFSMILRREGGWMLEGLWTIKIINEKENGWEDIIVCFNTNSKTVFLRKGNIEVALPFINYNGTNIKFIMNDVNKEALNSLSPDFESLFKSIVKFTPTSNNNGCSVWLKFENKNGTQSCYLERTF